MATSRIGVRAVISGVMIVLGVFLAVRLMMRPDQPLTGTRVLDIAFAIFFLARGTLYFWMQRRHSRG